MNPIRLITLSAVIAAALCLVTQTSFAQTSDANRKRGGGEEGKRGGFNPQDMQVRMMTALRERFEVPNDEEWNVISERITKVMELRRNAAPAAALFFGRGGESGRGDSSRGGRTGRPAEVEALQAAVKDKLPEAEIKSRLARVRELRKASEAKLEKAQEDLRAVLSVQQEAIAVLAGLLP